MRTVRLTTQFAGDHELWVDRSLAGDAHYVLAWINFLVWFHNKNTPTFTLRYLNPNSNYRNLVMTTVVRKDIKSFNIGEK